MEREKLQELKPMSEFLRKFVQEADISGREQAAKKQQEVFKKALLEKEEKNKLLMKQNLSQQKQEQEPLQKTKDDHQPNTGNESTSTSTCK